MELHIVCEQSKEEGKGKESIQLSNTHDLGHGMVWEVTKNNMKTSHTREPRDQPFPNRDYKAKEIDMTGKTH